MKTIVRNFYQPSVLVVNLSDTATLGPDEAAFATRKLVRPRTVIPSHINEAATTGGQPTGERMKRFLDQMDGSGIGIVLPLSGVTREFDGSGQCLNCP
jgi:L-ascorbate metabolism protein UlaG (beta-lactamase superfamily)